MGLKVDKDLKKAIKLTSEYVMKHAVRSSNEHYMLVKSDGTQRGYENAGCFGSFPNGKATWGVKFEALIFHHLGYAQTEDTKAFLDWALNRSPYAHVFITKKVEDILDYPCVVDTKHLPQLVIGAAMLVRYRYFMKNITVAWARFVKAGATEDMAFILAHYFQIYDKRGCLQATDGGGHGLFDPSATPQGLKNFLNHTNIQSYYKTNETVYDGNYNYKMLWSIWGMAADRYTASSLVKLPKTGKPIEVKSGWDNSKTKLTLYMWEDFDEMLASFIKLNDLKGAYENNQSFSE